LRCVALRSTAHQQKLSVPSKIIILIQRITPYAVLLWLDYLAVLRRAVPSCVVLCRVASRCAVFRRHYSSHAAATCGVFGARLECTKCANI
jgi:hypothetical protein